MRLGLQKPTGWDRRSTFSFCCRAGGFSLCHFPEVGLAALASEDLLPAPNGQQALASVRAFKRSANQKRVFFLLCRQDDRFIAHGSFEATLGRKAVFLQ